MKSSSRIVVGASAGFILLVAILIIANILVKNVSNPIYGNTINFFNSTIGLLLIIFLVGMINDLFWNFKFPFNLVAPITGAFLSIFIVNFIYNIWQFSQSYIHSGFYIPVYPIYSVVFLIVLGFGYFNLVIKERGGKDIRDYKEYHEKKNKEKEKIYQEIKKRRKEHKKIEWRDVGNEFKLALYNLGDSINDAFDRKKDKHSDKEERHKKGKIRE
jgi:hypothetical protein